MTDRGLTHPLTRNVHDDRRVTDMAAYEANGGYRGCRKAITSMSPEDCLQVIKDSNLRGRAERASPRE